MRWAYQSSPLWFVLAKLAIAQGSVLLLWSSQNPRMARVAEAMGAGVYLVVLAWHFACVVQLPV